MDDSEPRVVAQGAFPDWPTQNSWTFYIRQTSEYSELHLIVAFPLTDGSVGISAISQQDEFAQASSIERWFAKTRDAALHLWLGTESTSFISYRVDQNSERVRAIKLYTLPCGKKVFAALVSPRDVVTSITAKE